jgi:hypothetical protein
LTVALVTSATSDVVLALVTALFGLVGTLVGAGLTFQAGRSERRARQDDEARNHLLSVSNAIHRLWWMTRVGASQPEDVAPGPGGIQDDLRTSARNARGSLLAAGVPYRIGSLALEPTDRLAFRWGQRKVLAHDPEDAQVLVAFLIDLLDHRRAYRRSRQAWTRLKTMEQLGRGNRPLEGVPEGQNTFGYVPQGPTSADEGGGADER